MKQKLRVFLTLLLCTVASVGWGQTSVTIWEEDWSSGKKNDLVSSITNPTAVYSTGGTSTGNYATIYEESLAGGTSPELLIPKSSNKQTFISTINLNGVNGDLTLTFKSNKNITITSSTQNVTITKISGTTTTKAWEYTISVPAGTETLVLTFAMTTDSNARIDDIKLVGTKSGNTPSLSVSPASIAFGEKAINDSYYETFDVTFANLTEDLTVSVGSGLTGVSVSPTTISKEATSPQTVTVTYAPTTVGIISGNITVSNTDDEVSQTIEVSGSSYDASNVAYYEKVNSSLSDWSGDYIFTGINSSKYYALTGVDNNLGTTAEVSVTENGIISNSTTNAYKVTIAPTTNGYSLYMAGVGYLSYSGTSNQLHASDDFEASTCEWTISFANGIATITNIGANTRILQYNYNNGNPRFACYTSNQTKLTLFKLDDGTPYISAEDINIAYDATVGSIAYTIENAVAGTSLNATTTATWLNLGEVGANSVPFTCSANETTEPRTATVTLTYGLVTMNVTVTQAAAPVTYTTIPDIFTAAIDAGSTATNVNVTFGNWVVSGVGGSNVYVTDNNGNGFIIYKSDHGFTVNDKLSGTVTETPLKLYGGAAEFTGLTVSSAGLNVTKDGTITVITDKTIAALGGVNTGAVVSYEGLTCSVNSGKYYLTDGTNTLQVYNSLYAFDALEDGVKYNITGVYQQYNNTKEILPRSADDIVKVEEPSITVASAEVEVDAAGAEGTINVTYNNIANVEAEVQFVGADGTSEATYDWIVAEVNDENNISYIVNENTNTEARTAYLKVYALDDNANDVYSDLITIVQAAAVSPGTGDQYELFSGELVEGDYIIYYDGKAMNTTVTNDRLQYAEVTPSNNVITTDNAAIVWHIAPNGEYWTIYNADANAYAAGTGAKNKAQMLADGTDDKALWTVSGTETYEFVNKQNTANSVNANLRNNGTYGFACYATGTGGALSLYKKVTDTPETESVTVGQVGYTTYVTKNNVAIPEGIEVYIVTDINESSIHMEPVTGAIPANTPIVVKASEATYELTATDGETADVSANLLLGSDGKVFGNGSTIYALGVGKTGDADGKVGFYRVKSGATVPAGKAYLDTSVGAKDFLNFDFDETDGIGQIEMGQTSNAEIYNHSGQKVNKAQKGIYIVNGKKVVIR